MSGGAGVYILTSVINIRKSILIRGDGQGETILRFPKSMTELYGNTVSERVMHPGIHCCISCKVSSIQ